MPTYEFKCENCQHDFTIVESMKDTTPTRECPECGEIAKKVIGIVNFTFKGGGWSAGNNPHEKFDNLNKKPRKRKEKEPEV